MKIRKTRIDYLDIMGAKGRLETGQEISESDRKVLLDLIQDASGRLFPNESQMNEAYDALECINVSTSMRYNEARVSAIRVFEMKFCQPLPPIDNRSPRITEI